MRRKLLSWFLALGMMMSLLASLPVGVYAGSDDIAPQLTSGTIFRSSAGNAEVRFVSDKDGTYYYYVSDVKLPPEGERIVSDGEAGEAITAGDQAIISLTGLETGARYVHIVLKDSLGDLSNVITSEMPTDVYYYENFECYDENNYPLYFQQKYNGAGNSEQKVISGGQKDGNSGKVFRLKGQSSWSSDQRINLALPSGFDGVVTYEVDVKPISNGPGGIALGQSNIQWTGGIVRVGMDNGKFNYIIGDYDSHTSAIEYNLNTWYHIKIVLDYANRVFDYYINGEKVNIEPCPAHLSYNLTYLGLYSGNSSGGNEVYYDNVRLYLSGSIAHPAMTYTLDTPDSIKKNDVTATVTFDKESPVEEGADVTAEVVLTGTAVESGIHSIDLTSAKAGLASNPQTVSVAAGQNLTAAPIRKNFSFTMPTQAVDDFVLTHIFESLDTRPPVLTPGTISRISDNEATVTFDSDEAGEYYYAVTEGGAGVPVIDTSIPGTSCDTNLQIVSLNSLIAGAKDIYIVVKDAANNVSNPLLMEIPAYMPPEPGRIQFDSSYYSTYEGYNGWIWVERINGSDGVVTVDYSTADDTAIAGIHYQPQSGTLTWYDGDDDKKYIPCRIINDNSYNGYLYLTYTLSNPTGGAVIGEQNPLIVELSDNDAPPVPTGLKTVAGNGKVSLSWDPVNSAYYKLYYSTVEEEIEKGDSIEVYEGETYTISGLKNDTTYYFAIKACHNIYYSGMSGTVRSTPNASSTGGTSRTSTKYAVKDGNHGLQVGGQTELSKVLAKKGDEVIITVIPDKGFESAKPVVLDKNKKPLEIMDNGDGTFSFKMPAGEVTIETEFNKIDYFDDVSKKDWFDEAAWYCAAKGLMQGTKHRQFDGHIGTSRAMLVTVLYRMANSTDDFGGIFDDVESGNWYWEAINWAAHNKIVEGYGNGKFGPDDNLTREQMVSILYRYSIFMKYDLDKTKDLDSITDADTISKWALEPMKWAVGNGIVEGIGNGYLSPTTGASRAQFASMIQRYVTTIVK